MASPALPSAFPPRHRPTCTGPTPEPPISTHPAVADIAELAREAGIRRVHVLAWRDLDDVEAGGSEIHIAHIARYWAEAGLELTMRTSHAQGQPLVGERDGYHVIRRSGRYGVFPHAIASELLQAHGPRDAVVEIWNGVPFLTPAWFRGPRLIVLHHVHQKMWEQVLPPRMATFGKVLEARLAPPFYQRSRFVTPSGSSRDEMDELLGIPRQNISVVPPGIDPRFQPGAPKSEHPLLVSVGRLVPPKRFNDMIRIAAEVRRTHPDLELVIVGEGYEHLKLQQLVADLDARDWVRLAGRVSDDELVWLYQRAWAVTSASSAEGWGMTLTEAAACGTPAVATRIGGHADSVIEGTTGLLGADQRDMVEKISAVIEDAELRTRLAEGALKRANELTWQACAFGTFAPLAADALDRRSPRRQGDRP